MAAPLVMWQGHMAVCLWDTLRTDYMLMLSIGEWLMISDRFYHQWNVPNCLGSIDGKLKVSLQFGISLLHKPRYFSVALLGCVDADSLFIWISVTSYGRNNDGRVIRSVGFFNAVKINEMNIPDPRPLPKRAAPLFLYFFVADQGFSLNCYLFRPYPRKTQSDDKRAFNYRLSRAKKTVECAF